MAHLLITKFRQHLILIDFSIKNQPNNEKAVIYLFILLYISNVRVILQTQTKLSHEESSHLVFVGLQ